VGLALVVGAQELWKFGTQERVQLGTPVVLVADVVNGAAESRYSALRAPGAAAGYTVTAGRTLWLTRLIVSCSVLNGLWLLGSGTADAGDSQVAAPAGAASEDSRADGVANALVTQAALAVSDHAVAANIAASRLPFVRGMTAAATYRVLAFGIEV
jgi:hypothetical protein